MPLQDINEVLDAALLHGHDLERYKNGVVRRIVSLLNEVSEDIIAQLGTVKLTDFQQGRLLAMEQRIQSFVDSAGDHMQRNLETELRSLVGAELEFHQQTVSVLTPAAAASTGGILIAGSIDLTRINADDVYAAAIGQPFNGQTLGEWFKRLDDATATRLLQQIRIGYAEGETMAQIIQRIRGTAAEAFTDGAFDRWRRDAETAVRTAVQYFSNFAQRKTMERAGIEHYQWISVLDSRTTPICRARSNHVYQLGSGPMPPAHPRCRSTTVPLLSKGEVLQVPSYADWLRQQPRWRIDDILGPARAKLFLQGRMKLEQFVNRQGRELTLEELRARFPGYWRRTFGA